VVVVSYLTMVNKNQRTLGDYQSNQVKGLDMEKVMERKRVFMHKLFKKKDSSQCEYKGCDNKCEVILLGHPLCDKHWEMWCRLDT